MDGTDGTDGMDGADEMGGEEGIHGTDGMKLVKWMEGIFATFLLNRTKSATDLEQKTVLLDLFVMKMNEYE